MKEPLCMKKVHSNFNRKIYMQVDGISMGSPLEPVLTDVFIIELEKAVSPELTECNKYWNRYVDDTISFIKIGTINCIIEKLNSFENMQFTFEDEDKGTLLFLDVLICRTCNLIVKNVLRKPTRLLAKRNLKNNNGMCLEKVSYETNDYPQCVIKQIRKQVQHEQNK